MSVTHGHEVVFEPLSESFARDPYAVYAQLRQNHQPHYYEDFDVWLLSRYEDVEKAALNPAFVRSPSAFMSPQEEAHERRKANWHDMPNHSRFVQFSLLDSDGDVHFRLRKIVLGKFTGRYVERHRSMIVRYVDSLLDDLLDKGQIDFIADLACHVPGHIIGNVLGVPDDDCPQLRIWSENVVQFFDVARTDEHKKLAEQATTEFYEYLVELIARRSRQPKDDLVSTLIEAKNAGEMDETELISTCMLILMAGHGSTIDVMGSGMHTLLQNPGELKRLRADPGLMATAVQEMFRYESPLPFFHRYATEDVEVLGQRFPKGSRFGLLYGSANRDSAVFPDADRFDVGRTPNRHIAFGRGPHLCLGNHLSRLDMEILFSALLAKTRSIELATDEVAFKRSLSVRGPVCLPLSMAPA
ncbi:MAG: cytochrome P450 [Woeseiaceae bacterium]|nr:cytochrome P450 [Woeseiaceae bacterium]